LAFSLDGRSLAVWRDDAYGGLTRLWFAPSFDRIAKAQAAEEHGRFRQ